MSQCQFQSRLTAFHDHELEEAIAARLQSHLAACPTCSTELAELESVSRLLGAVETGAISPLGMARLHMLATRAAAEQRREIMPVMRALLAVAASILVVAGAWLYELPRGAPRDTRPIVQTHAPAEWETLASGGNLAPPGSVSNDADLAAAEEWMVDGLKR